MGNCLEGSRSGGRVLFLLPGIVKSTRLWFWGSKGELVRIRRHPSTSVTGQIPAIQAKRPLYGAGRQAGAPGAGFRPRSASLHVAWPAPASQRSPVTRLATAGPFVRAASLSGCPAFMYQRRMHITYTRPGAIQPLPVVRPPPAVPPWPSLFVFAVRCAPGH